MNKELNELGLTYNPENEYTVHRGGIELKHIIPPGFPFKEPILLFEGIVCDAAEHWVPSITLNNYITKNINTIHRVKEITLPVITDPAYLVLGSSRVEERNGRTHYDSPNVFLLDTEQSDIPISFKSSLELGIVASRLPDRFDEICFDWSTLKFFSDDPTLRERLVSLNHMLKPGGSIYFETIHGQPGGAYDRTDKYTARFIEFCKQAGFVPGDIVEADQIQGSVLVPMLYIGDRANTRIFTATKPLSGGRRTKRYRKRRRKRTLKHYRVST